MTALLNALAAALPAGAVVTDPDVVAAYAADQCAWVSAGSPAAVVFPATTAEVAAVVALCAEHRVVVVARGAGSGLSGGAAAIDGCVVLCLTRMDRVLDIDVADQLAVVQPGVINADLSKAVAEHGLWYPPDPASWEFSTIGGNVATNAGGLCCVKYGVTADYVLALEVVLADGSVVRTGRRTPKGVAGYDLTRLFVGSEGTLGVVTEVTVRLRRARPAPSTVVASFSSLVEAGAAVIALAAEPSRPALMELIDRTTLCAVDDWKNLELDRDAAALLIVQSDAGGANGAADAASYTARCEEAGAELVMATDDPAEGAELLAVRRLCYPALERLGATLLDDVAVPLSRVTDLVRAVEKVAERTGVLIGTFGHAGDGNLHPTVVYDATDDAQRALAGEAFDGIVAAALELGGTVTGEHGVGALKSRWLAEEIGPAGLSLHRTVKDALDPLGILNPGKLF